MRLDLEDLAEKESYEVPGFVERLLGALPGLQEHYCGLGRPGGFVERLHGGTWFGHIVEHVCLELTDRAGISVNRGKTVSAGCRGVFDVAVEFRSESGMRRLLEIAVEYVEALVADRSYPLDDRIAEVIELVERDELGPSTRAIVNAAAARGIPWTRLNQESLVQLGFGTHRRFIQAAMSSQTNAIAVDIAGDKALTKALLDRAGIPTPAGAVVGTADEAVREFETMGSPAVVKPLDGNQGKAVSLHLSTAAQVREAFETASHYSSQVIIEELLDGNDFRVLVVDGKMVAASQRCPASVVGDGRRTVRELIEETNGDPRRGDGHSKPMSTIRIDPVLVCCLAKQDLHLDAVPAAGMTVRLRENANLSTGGAAIDVTDRVHPTMRRICERAAIAVGLDICGVDLVVPDIAESFQTGGIVEVNAAPGIRMHHWPTAGTARDVGAEIIRMLYPVGDGRVPIVSITGTNGKTTVTRLVTHILSRPGLCVGMTTTDGIWIGGEQVAAGDTTGPRSAATVLSDPRVEMAVLETARGGIVRNGLGYDWSDVGVMTNIAHDHIGQDGIEDVQDILRIKSLVAERVREGGVLVLNADDELLRQVPDSRKVSRVPKRVVWFARDRSNSFLAARRDAGDLVYFVHDGWIVEANGPNERHIVRPASIPLTFQGAAWFQIANVMAAVAVARALDMGVARIRMALKSFQPLSHNPARANLYAVEAGYVLFDYGHNPAALEAIAETAANWPAGTVTAVLGLPGDRDDGVIRQSARIAARFDRVIIREDRDLRGRRPGELAAIIQDSIRSENPEAEILTIPDEAAAMTAALDRIGPGELVVAFCDDCESVRQLLTDRGAAPALNIAIPVEGERVRVA
jgi:cyanophycin synthetase